MIDLIPLFVVAVIAVVAMAFYFILQGRHSAQVNALLAVVATERHAWARERHELNTRIQAPEVARTASAAIPAPASPQDALLALGVLQPQAEDEPDEDDVDETYLVGTHPGEA